MQIVIDIDEQHFKILQGAVRSGMGDNSQKIIANGTPLPKGHGRLIDIKDLRQDIIAHKYSNSFCEEHHIEQSINVGILNILLADTPTIIEADK